MHDREIEEHDRERELNHTPHNDKTASRNSEDNREMFQKSL